MREKAHYTDVPQSVTFARAGSRLIVTFAESIAQTMAQETPQYTCDVYRLDLPYAPGLAARIAADPAPWLQKARDEDYAHAAAKVRAKRDALLRESDKDMALDRLGLLPPTGSTFSAWLSFLRALGTALSGVKAQYRQALRDIPQQEGFPYAVAWPERPATFS